jgi:hypothetical protein
VRPIDLLIWIRDRLELGTGPTRMEIETPIPARDTRHRAYDVAIEMRVRSPDGRLFVIAVREER